jgi:plastocyanin
MKKVAIGVLFVTLFTSDLLSSTVSGTVTFLTRRGQRVNPAETLVWLEPGQGTKAPKKAPPAHSTPAVVSTQGKALQPHVTAIPAGSSVQFPNEDPISHNLFSVSASNQFDLGLYRRGAGKVQHFSKPGIVNVYCNVHPNMSAVIHVMETPYYTFADAKGAFTLADVAPGKYALLAWTEQAGVTRKEIDVSADVVSGLAVELDGRNYRASQKHLNKHGKPYQTRDSSKDY